VLKTLLLGRSQKFQMQGLKVNGRLDPFFFFNRSG